MKALKIFISKFLLNFLKIFLSEFCISMNFLNVFRSTIATIGAIES